MVPGIEPGTDEIISQPLVTWPPPSQQNHRLKPFSSFIFQPYILGSFHHLWKGS